MNDVAEQVKEKKKRRVLDKWECVRWVGTNDTARENHALAQNRYQGVPRCYEAT